MRRNLGRAHFHPQFAAKIALISYEQFLRVSRFFILVYRIPRKDTEGVIILYRPSYPHTNFLLSAHTLSQPQSITDGYFMIYQVRGCGDSKKWVCG